MFLFQKLPFPKNIGHPMMLEMEKEGKREREKKIWQVHKAVCFNCGHVAASATTVWPNLTFHLLCLFLLHLF